MTAPATWLKTVYEHRGDFYMLVGPDAIIAVESPAMQRERYDIKNPKETLLRLFLSAQEAEIYRDFVGMEDVRIMRTTLVGLWNIIPRIDSLSKKRFRTPVRIVVSNIDGTAPRTVDTLHSIYELLS